MGAITHGLALMALVTLPAQAWAGNSAMMAQTAEDLIEINQEVLDGLKAGSQDGEYHLMARIVEHNGERIIKVDRFERLGPPDPEGGIASHVGIQTAGLGKGVLAPYGEHAPSIRFGPIPTSYNLTGSQGAPLTSYHSTASLPMPVLDDRRKLEVLFNTHPNIKMIDLSPEDMKQLSPLKPLGTGGGGVLLYW